MDRTTELKPPDNPPPQLPLAKLAIFAATFLSLVVALGSGYFIGSSLEANTAEETLSAITAVANQDQQTLEARFVTGTAVVNAYTATPLPTATPSATNTPVMPEGFILPLTVQLRELPDTESAVIANLNQRTAIEIVALTEDSQWVEIVASGPDGGSLQGFVPASAIQQTGGSLDSVAIAAYPTASPTDEPPTPTATPVLPQANVLPIRVVIYSGPGEVYPMLDALNQASLVEIVGLSEDGLWAEIVYRDTSGNEGTGYVQTDALQLVAGSLSGVPVADFPTLTPTITPSPSSTPSPLPSLTPTPQSPLASAAGYLVIVREGPDNNFATVGVVESDQTLPINGISLDGLWFQVSFEPSLTGLGWVSVEHVIVSGDIENLPVVRGPVLPEPQATEQTTGPVPTQPSDTTVDLAALPTQYRTDFAEVPDLDAYAFEVLVSIDGDDSGSPYQASVKMELAQAPQQSSRRLLMELNGNIDGFQEIAELFPLVIGSIGDTTYVYIVQDEFCLPAEDSLEIDFILSDFSSLIDGAGQEVITFMNDVGAFKRIENDGLLGLAGPHYQFVGLRDNSEAGYHPSDNIKIDLWFTDDESILYAFAMTFQFQEGSDAPEEVLELINPGVATITDFTGTASAIVLPVAVNENAVPYTEPPSACDFLFE